MSRGGKPPVELVFTDEANPFDPDELVRWAEKYGHPEEWAKRAQAADARADRYRHALEQIGDEQCDCIGYDRCGSCPDRLAQIARRALGNRR